MHPDNTWMHYEQGVHLYNAGYYPEAAQELALYNDAYLYSLDSKAYFDPESAKRSLYLTAKIYDEKLRQYPEAAEWYQLALDCFPDAKSAEKATFRLGDIYYRHLGEYELAVEQFELYLERFLYEAKDAAQAVINIAAIYEHDLKDPVKAIEAYQRFVKYFPGYSAVTFCLGKIIKLFKELGDYEQTAAALEKYLDYCQHEATAEDIVLQLIDIYENILQDYKSAIKMREYYISRFPEADKNKQMQIKIAELYYYELKDYEQALKAYYTLLNNYEINNDAYILDCIANIYIYKLQQLDKGIEVLKVKLEKYGSDPYQCAQMQFHIGEAYESFARHQEAANSYMSFLATVWEHYDLAPYLPTALPHATEYMEWYCSNYDCASIWETQ